MSMEFLLATGVGALVAVGIYLILMLRTFPVIVGLSFLSYAVNVFLFAMGRLAIDLPPIVGGWSIARRPIANRNTFTA